MTQFIEKEQEMIRKDCTHNATKQSACHHLADDEEFCEAAGAGDAQRGSGE